MGRMSKAEKAKHAAALAFDKRIKELEAALAAVPNDGDVVANVLKVVADHKMTSLEFMKLDGRDGYGRVPSWHWKLRVTRNAPGGKLFDLLDRIARGG